MACHVVYFGKYAMSRTFENIVYTAVVGHTVLCQSGQGSCSDTYILSDYIFLCLVAL